MYYTKRRLVRARQARRERIAYIIRRNSADALLALSAGFLIFMGLPIFCAILASLF